MPVERHAHLRVVGGALYRRADRQRATGSFSNHTRGKVPRTDRGRYLVDGRNSNYSLIAQTDLCGNLTG